jgi:dipeptidyl aminopeptidase/acylaminoacyl peptidase
MANTSCGFTSERLVFGMKAAGSPAISPDGSTVAYAVSQEQRDPKAPGSRIWTIPVMGGEPAPLSPEEVAGSNPVWSPDGTSVAFVLKDTNDKPHAIAVIPAGGGETSELTRHRPKPLSLAWSPDGGSIAYSVPVDPDNPNEHAEDKDAPPKVRATRRLDYKQDNRGLLYDTRLQVMVLDVASGERRQLTSELVDHTEPQWSPDGASIAVKVLNRNGMHSQLGVIDIASGEVTLVGNRDWSIGTWRWSPDGAVILCDGIDQPSPQTDYWVYEVSSGALRRLTDDLDFSPEAGYPTLGSPAQPVWLDDSTALVHGIRAGRSLLRTIDTESGVIKDLARFDATHAGLAVDAARRTIVQVQAKPTQSGELVATDLATGESRALTHLNDELLAETPACRSEKGSVERGGETIDYWITLPPDFTETGSYPVIIDVHGGPHGNYGYQFNKAAIMLANAGIVVVSSNPRGSGTYGRRFSEAVRGDWGGEDWLDVQAALDDVLTRPWADSERTGIIGYSYGGFMTAWAIGHTDRFKAAVCGALVFDLESFYGRSDIGHVWGVHQWGGELPDHRDWMLEHSPSTHIHNAVTPTLIIHGEQDHRCPIGQGEALFTSLSRNGVETEFVRYPGGSHLMFHSGPAAHKADYYTRIREWFTAHF